MSACARLHLVAEGGGGDGTLLGGGGGGGGGGAPSVTSFVNLGATGGLALDPEASPLGYTLLVDVKSNPNKLVGYQKLSQNTRKEKVQLKFLAPNEGTVNYEVHAICSSYLGADKKVRTKTDRTLTLNLDLSRDPPTLTLTL